MTRADPKGRGAPPPLQGSEIALILATAVIHAGGWIAAGIAVGTIAPITLASLRFLLAGSILLVVARWRGSSLGTADWRSLLAVSLIGVALSHALFYNGLRLAPVADGVVLSTALSPTLAVVFALPLLHERISARGVVGVALSAAGVTLVVLDAGSVAGGGRDRIAGDALVIAGAVTTALYTVIGRMAMRSGSPLGVVASTTFIGGLALVPLALFEAMGTPGRTWSPEVWLAFLYLTLPSAGISAVLYYMLIRQSGAARASLVAYVVPVIVLAWSTAIQGEPLTVARVAGAIFAIIGVRLVLSSSSPLGPSDESAEPTSPSRTTEEEEPMTHPTRAGFTVRPMRPEDVPAARAIMIRTFEEDFGTGYQPSIHTDVADLAAVYLANPRHAMFVAVDDETGEIVATAGVRDGALKPGVSPEALVRRYEPDRTAQLVRVYTLPEHRRRGIARALVRAALQFVLADGRYSLVALHTYPHSPGALAFWKSVGTTLVEDDRDGPSRAVFFEMPLDRVRRFVAASQPPSRHPRSDAP